MLDHCFKLIWCTANLCHFSIAGFYDTGEEELPDYQPDFKKLRQDHLEGKMRDDIEQVTIDGI